MNPIDQPELPAAPADEPAVPEQIERDLASLQSVVTMIVAGLLILTVAVNVFIWRQVRVVRNQLADERRQIDEYNRADPAVRDLLRRLQAFAASNPDFQPVIARYAEPSTNQAAPKTVPKSPAPATAPKAAPKK